MGPEGELKVGEKVWYVMPDGASKHGGNPHRPALIVHIWPKENYPDGETVQLFVFGDQANGEQTCASSVPRDEANKGPHTWYQT